MPGESIEEYSAMLSGVFSIDTSCSFSNVQSSDVSQKVFNEVEVTHWGRSRHCVDFVATNRLGDSFVMGHCW